MLSRLTTISSILTFLLALCASASASAGRMYYVDSLVGDDAHSGYSPKMAWKTIAAVNAHQFLPGDGLHFHSGQQFSGMLRLQGSGTARAPIFVRSYGDGHPPRLVGEGGLATVSSG